MKIFYTNSYYGKYRFQKYYDLIISTLKKSGHEIISPELGNHLKLIPPRVIKTLKTKDKIHYEGMSRGVKWADVVIFEITYEDFQIGHEATVAIQNKKHVLALSLEQDFAEKINNHYFHGFKYNEQNLKETIEKFIAKHKDNNYSERFNLMLSNNQRNRLKELSRKTNLTESELIRRFIDSV